MDTVFDERLCGERTRIAQDAQSIQNQAFSILERHRSPPD
jgi:hypothetical protein